ncbi:phage tail tape measure protein [Sinorhizobium meliloti]|uniref:phage tail length tape measure family protein n=1 Tax=Rhizobium meliloti TaxID=382 RepID=UPI000FDADF97|nr:phage tail length tape measure family protein [Sinorhizobium meliloti]RVO55137.1 phage tail tape measure protein [Sinorhizobium meliloti]
MVEKTDDLVISISTDLATVKRSLKRLEADISSTTGKVEKQFNALGNGIDKSMSTALQKRIDGMVGVGTRGAKEWSGALADQGKELERLRARYSPLFATINNYKSAVADIKRAHSIGAISANEMTAAIQRERQAALASTAAIKGRNAALAASPRGGSSQGFATANIASQFQDIAVTSAMGMNPLQIALQQGTQLSSVLGTMGNGRQVVAGLAAAFTSLISPVSLVTIGLVAGGAAAIQYFSSLDLGGEKSEKTLQKEAELVQAVVTKWGDALPALKAYSEERDRVASEKDLSAALDVGKSALWDDLRKQLGDVDIAMSDIVSRISQMGEDASEVIKLQATFNELTKGIDEGKASVDLAKRAHEELAEIVKNNASPELEAYLEIFKKLVPAIDAASRSAQKFDRDAAIARTSRFPSRGTYGGVERSADGSIQGGGIILPDSGPVPERRPLIELDGLPGEQKDAKKAETAAQRAANAYRDLVKSADDRIAQLQLETELTGEYGVQTDAARFRLELLQQAEDKGRSLSAEQRAEIEKKVELYSKYSQALAQAKLHQDLLDDSAFAGLSKQEQAVKLRLRSYGLDEDLGGNNAAMIRNRLQQEELSDLTQSFLSEFSSGILTGGKSIGESFADAVKNAAANAMQKSLDSLFEQIGGALASALLGGGGKSGGIAAVASSAATTFAAPVGAVTRSALPAAMPTGDIASYITQAAIKRGIDPAIALKVAKSEGGLDSWNLQSNYVKNGVREPSFGPFQLYKGGGLGNAMIKQTGLDPALAANGPAGVDFALDNAKKSGWGQWYGAAKVGVGDWEGIGKGAGSASEALEKLAGASNETTTGLGALGSTLQSIPQALMANGGGGGVLGSLTKYGMGLFSGSGQFASAWMSGGIGLYDKGGFTGTGGKYTPAGIVHKGEYVFDAAAVSRIGVPTLERLRGYANGGMVGAPRAPRLNGRGTSANSNVQPGILQVHVSGASGDEHIRTLVKQGVGEGLSQYNENQRRGGFGTMQSRYTSQKG